MQSGRLPTFQNQVGAWFTGWWPLCRDTNHNEVSALLAEAVFLSTQNVAIQSLQVNLTCSVSCRRNTELSPSSTSFRMAYVFGLGTHMVHVSGV